MKMTEVQSFPSLYPEGLSSDCMPSYALAWVRLPGTGAQAWGPKHLTPTTSDKFDAPCTWLHTNISAVLLYVCLQN